jgi:hypothetical protein
MEINMNIEFTVEDYFKELQLMESQYGQEEGLYPWIYMLLQMVECQKKRILEVQYNPLSIRDVHKAQSSSNSDDSKPSKIKKMLTAKLGAPDFTVLDIDSKHFLGCIEIKQLDDSLKIKEANASFPKMSNINVTKKEIKYIFNVKTLVETLKSINTSIPQTTLNSIEQKLKSIEKPYIPEIDDLIIEKLNEDFHGLKTCSSLPNDVINIKYITQWSNSLGFYGNRSYGVEFPYETSMDDESSIEIELQLYGQPIKITRKQQNSKYSYTGNYGWYEEAQIISHLEKFKKVLYTNGLEFYFLTLSKDEKTINIKKLADLRSIYKSYCDYCQRHIPLVAIPSSYRLFATAEWDKLIAGLTAIDWHREPITKID